MKGTKHKSSGKRLLLAAFLALAGAGVTSYLFASIGMLVTVVTSGRNSANIPAFNNFLRAVALPSSVLVGILVFVIAFRRLHATQGATTHVDTRPSP